MKKQKNPVVPLEDKWKCPGCGMEPSPGMLVRGRVYCRAHSPVPWPAKDPGGQAGRRKQW